MRNITFKREGIVKDKLRRENFFEGQFAACSRSSEDFSRNKLNFTQTHLLYALSKNAHLPEAVSYADIRSVIRQGKFSPLNMAVTRFCQIHYKSIP